MKKIIEVIKKKWLRDTVLTTLLVAILVLAFIALNMWVATIEISNWDFTKEQIYTLSDESKNLMKDIEKDVSIYFVNYTDDDLVINLAKQYHETNEKIQFETMLASERADIAQTYGIEDDATQVIIVRSGEREKILTYYDLSTYDTTSWNTIDISEQKITNAVLDVTSDEKPTIYFLTGHNEYSTSSEMMTIAAYIQNEVMEIADLNLMATDIPEDCQTIIIATPILDFYDTEVEKLTNYINRGGNIIWMQDPSINELELPNAQKILDLYGVSFGSGMVMEQDANRMIMENPQLILPNISYTTITEDLSSSGLVLFASSGKLNIESSEKLEELNVTVDEFLTTSETAFYRTDFTITSARAQGSDEVGTYTVGATFTKDLSSGEESEDAENSEETKTSKLIAFANNLFVTDAQITSGSQYITIATVYNNKDLLLNSVAYSEEKEDQIRIRKNYESVTYTPTEFQNNVVLAIIFIIPLVIVIAGIIIWQVRRRKK